jgi:hypothetical protein
VKSQDPETGVTVGFTADTEISGRGDGGLLVEVDAAVHPMIQIADEQKPVDLRKRIPPG